MFVELGNLSISLVENMPKVIETNKNVDRILIPKVKDWLRQTVLMMNKYLVERYKLANAEIYKLMLTLKAYHIQLSLQEVDIVYDKVKLNGMLIKIRKLYADVMQKMKVDIDFDL